MGKRCQLNAVRTNKPILLIPEHLHRCFCNSYFACLAMAFFGLTSLGPQNTFSSNLAASMMLTEFTAAEFAAAFAKVDKAGSGGVDFDALPALLDIVYLGPAPEAQVGRVMDYFAASRGGVVSRAEFDAGIAELRERGASESENAHDAHLLGKTYSKLKDDIRRNKRVELDPNETLAQVSVQRMRAKRGVDAGGARARGGGQ